MRPSRLSPRRNAVADYLRIIRRDKTLTDEARRYLQTQAGALLREFRGASASELLRLRAVLELVEVARDRAQSWEVRGPANDRAARLLAGLGVRSRVERAVRRPRRPSARADVFTHAANDGREAATNDTGGGSDDARTEP